MPPEEKLQFDKMAKEIAAIKRWVPIFMFFGTVICLSVTGTRWFDKNVITRADFDSLKNEQHADQVKTRQDIADLKASFNNHLSAGLISKAHTNGRIDSVARVTYSIQRHEKFRFVIESYPNGRNHDPKVTPANQY